MNENLAQLVKDSPTEEIVFQETSLDIPSEISEAPAIDVVENDTPEPAIAIPIVPLTDWFESNCQELDNINQVKVSIRGIDPKNTLIMAVKDESGEQDEDGHDKRHLRVFENASSIPVLAYPPIAMNIYNNGFRIIYKHTDNIYIKAYGVRTGLICTLCTLVGDKLVPYGIIKLKKKDEEILIPAEYPTITDEVLTANADLEALQLLYKQSSKIIDTLSTNQSVINWLIEERQSSITDISHHLQIDNVLISMLK